MRKKAIDNLTSSGITVAVVLANFLYLLFKIMPTQNKVIFMSRISDTIPLDFELIIDSLKEKCPTLKTVVLCKPLDYGLMAKVRYIPHIILQMYNIATSKVAIIDSYCIPICILHHKKLLKVIQLWHGLGSFKKFGHSILDKRESITRYVALDSKELAILMHMHENYNLIIASNKLSAIDFAEAFNYDPSIVKVISLPRVDFLTDEAKTNKLRGQILESHTELSSKKNILYAPTFRRSEYDFNQIQKLVDVIDFDHFNLIIKFHLLTKRDVDDNRITRVNDYTAMQLLTISDYVITDYSAIVYEAYLLNKPVFFYQFDLEKYEADRGFYTPISAFPAKSYNAASSLIDDLENDKYDYRAIKPFIDEQVTYKHGNADKIANIIIDYAEVVAEEK